MNLHYFTNFFVRTAAGTPQSRFSTTVVTGEQLLCPDAVSECLVAGAVYLEMGPKKGWNSTETVAAFNRYSALRKQVTARFGRSKKLPRGFMKPRSYWNENA